MYDPSSSKVVPLQKYGDADGKAAGSLTASEALRLRNDCRDRAVKSLGAAVSTMLHEVDDTLFDLSSKDQSGIFQSRYFDAMRLIRLKRDAIESEFRKELLEGFAKRIRSASEKKSSSGLSDDTELSLVDADSLEESLAVKDMVAKVSAACRVQLFELDRRMGVLLNKPDLEGTENPLGPEVICDAINAACAQTEAETEIKLIALKLFDRVVGARLIDFYTEMNLYLIGQGVLPKVRTSVRKAQSFLGRTPSVGTGSTVLNDEGQRGGENGEVAGTDLFSAIRQWLGRSGKGGSSASVSAARGTGGSVQTGEFLRTLTQLQQGRGSDLPGYGGLVETSAIESGNVNILRELQTSGIVSGMGDTDVLTLDVVTMLFDYILDDSDVPDAMKALIGRLQIPVLKAALMDRAIFSTKTHPVRRLLDTLAGAAIGWSEANGKDDPLYQKVESIVHRILERFERDLGVFNELLSELEEFLSVEQRDAQDAAEQSAEAIEERHRLAHAWMMAGDEIRRRTDKKNMPVTVRDFLNTHWKDLLAVTHIRRGEESPQWEAALRTMDDLIWSVLPKQQAEERQNLVAALPALVRRLKSGLKVVSMPERERANFMSTVADLQAAAVRGGREFGAGDIQPKGSITPLAERPSPVATISDSATSDATSSGSAGSESEEALPTEAPETESVGREVDTGADTDIERAPEHSELTEEARLLKAAFNRANEAIYNTAQKKPECNGMGTTLVAAMLHDDRITLGHVGDSRIYRLRSDDFRQMTIDHSLLQYLITQGFYTPEEAQQSGKKNYLIRAMGNELDVQLEIQDDETLPGDTYLLCSDGLTDLVEDEEIHLTLSGHRTNLYGAVQALVKAANDRGGKDNISAIVISVNQSAPSTSTEQDSEQSHSDLGSHLEMAAVSDVGMKRSHNEDSVKIDPLIGVALLADGMGGYNAGEVASAMAVDIIMDDVRRALGGEPDVSSEQENSVELEGDGSGVDVEEDMEEIVIAGADESSECEPTEDEFTQRVESLQIGSWVEFCRPDQTVRRARLSWISPTSGAYLFTDRHGAKVADATPNGLAVQLRRGEVQIMEGVPLFDRAVGKLMSHVRSAA